MTTGVTYEYAATEPKWCATHGGWFWRCYDASKNIDEWYRCLADHDNKIREQIAKEIESRLFAALGMASMCWSEVPTGVFDSERAEEIGNELLELIARGQK